MTYGEDRVSAKVVVGFAGLLIAAGATTVFALPAKVESIEGSELKRVILDPKEAERLHIEMTEVREEKIVHRTMVLGEVEDERIAKMPSRPPESGSAAPAAAPQPASSGAGRYGCSYCSTTTTTWMTTSAMTTTRIAQKSWRRRMRTTTTPLRAKRVALASHAETDANTLYFKIPAEAHHNLTPGQRVA